MVKERKHNVYTEHLYYIKSEHHSTLTLLKNGHD